MTYLRPLRTALTSGGFTWDDVTSRIGAAGSAGLARNSTIPAATTLDDDVQSTLIALWLLQQAVPLPATERALPGLVPDLVAAGLLTVSGDTVRARVELKPYAADDWTGWVCADPTPGLDGRPVHPRADHVLSVSGASQTLTEMTIPDRVGAALDLGTGCGVQALHLARQASRVVATDLNPRTLDLASVTLGLNEVTADLRLGDLYAPVADEAFDLIVTNPPFVMSPVGGERLVYREGSLPGDDLVRRVIVEGADRLAPGGTLQVLANWAITAEPWAERLTGWIGPTGCDALVMERERLDVFGYIEIWLADAGLETGAEYERRYRAWLDYFSGLGITEIGMGWIALHRGESATPDIVCESWPHSVHQPVGPAISQRWERRRLATGPVENLLAQAWVVADDVRQETLGHPTAPDPEAIVLRQSSGFGRAMRLDTVTAAFVSACDGDLPASRIVAALASLFEHSPADVLAEVLPVLRDLVADGFLVSRE